MSDLTYGSYLALDDLLALQRPRARQGHPDELLFIVVHQASELWFKVILHDLDGLIEALERHDTGRALWYVGRINALMRIVSAQLSALDSLPPHHFAEFRGYLGSSSGSQSVQFRAIEAASGLRDEHFMRVIGEHGEPAPAIRRALGRAGPDNDRDVDDPAVGRPAHGSAAPPVAKNFARTSQSAGKKRCSTVRWR